MSLSKRRLSAALVSVVWLLGFELTPNLHIGLHAWLEHHHHGDDDVHHEHDEDEPDHGAQSIEHRGLAVLGAPPPPHIPLVLRLEVSEPPPTNINPPRDRRPLSIRGRGPPSSLVS